MEINPYELTIDVCISSDDSDAGHTTRSHITTVEPGVFKNTQTCVGAQHQVLTTTSDIRRQRPSHAGGVTKFRSSDGVMKKCSAKFAQRILKLAEPSRSITISLPC